MPSRISMAGEKSMFGFKASNDKLTFSLGASAADDLKVKLIHTYHSGNPRGLKNYCKSIIPVLYKWKKNVWMIAHLYTTWFTEYFKPAVETNYSLAMHVVTQEL